jgi:ketosteroid isomerase-like protein
MKVGLLAVILAAGGGMALAQSPALSANARKWIDAGNRAWIEGMKTGNAALAASPYARDALDCGPTGACAHGHAAILRATRTLLARLGRARSAAVVSQGAVRRGGFLYEWGEARASFGGGRAVRGPYLTVWERRPDGSWKIIRNLALPASPARR